MKGRKVESLLKQVDLWHRQLNRSVGKGNYIWSSCGIPGLVYEEGKDSDKKIYTIKELLSTKELVQEGSAMRHCVGSYSYSCRKGGSAIYSLSVKSENGTKRLLTVEINIPKKAITQARGFANAFPDAQCQKILRKWTEKEKIGLSRWI